LFCDAHHWAVHEGGHRVRAEPSGRLAFLRPDGSVMPEVPGVTAVPMDPAGTLMARNRRCGLKITPETNLVGWGGEGLDLPWAVHGILQAEGDAR